MDTKLAQEAIKEALNENWKEAIKLNTLILKSDASNIDALNRLARAYAEEGQIDKAKTISKKALRIDPTNSIATKCIDKWSSFKKTKNNSIPSTNLARIFIEEPTKTKLITLINLGSPVNITSLNSGDSVKIVAHQHKVNVLTPDDIYIGRLPDNLAIKFRNMIKLGATFQVIVKSATKDDVKILARSIKSDL